MADNHQPLHDVGEDNTLPPMLAGIYHQLERDGAVWSRQVPDTAGLEDFVTSLATGKPSQLTIENSGKEVSPMKVTDEYNAMPLHEGAGSAPPSPPQRRRSFFAPLAAVVLVVLLVAVFVWRAQQHHTMSTITPATTVPFTLPANATVTATSLLSGDDIWGAGSTFSDPSDPLAPANSFIVHYTNGQWHMTDTIDFPNIVLESLTMLSDTEGWATGRVAAGQSPNAIPQMQDVVYHFANGIWSKANIAIPANRNVEVQPVGINDAWLLATNGGAATLWHDNAGSWQTITTPVTFSYFTMLSDNEGWFGQARTLWHYLNGQWHTSYSAAAAGPNASVTLQGFTAPNDGWGLQYADPNYNQQEGQPVLAVKTTVIHYDGTRWTPIATPSQLMPRPEFYIDQIIMHTAHDGWANVIEVPNGNETIDLNTAPRYLVHYLNGTWTLVTTPAKITFNAIKMTSTTEGWAVGQRYAANGIFNAEGLPVILHYQASTWSVVG